MCAHQVCMAGSWTLCTFNGARRLYARLLMCNLRNWGKPFGSVELVNNFIGQCHLKFAYKLYKACKLMLHMHMCLDICRDVNP